MIFKKTISAILACIMILSTSVQVFATTTTPPKQTTTPGNVSVNKTAKWVDEEHALVTLDVYGQSNLNGSDFLIVMDRSTSMADYNRSVIAKNSSKMLVDEIMAPIEYVDEKGSVKTVQSDNRVSFMSFATCYEKLESGKFLTSSTTNADKIKSHIDKVPIKSTVSNYDIAMCHIITTLNSRTEKTRPVYILFISGGETKKYACFDSYLKTIKGLVTGIGTVGLSVKNSVGRSLLQEMVKSPGSFNEYNELPNHTLYMLVDGLLKFGYAITSGTVEDQIGSNFTLVPHSEQYPWTFISNGNEFSNNDSITWNIGNLNGKESLSYYIKIKSNTPAGTYATNTSAQLNYINTAGKLASIVFPVPKLDYKGSISKLIYTVSHQYGDGVPVVTTRTANYGENILENPVNKAGYTFETVTVNAVNETGTQIAHNLTATINNQVAGTMPNGNVTINYKYTPLSNILYIVNYYKDFISEVPLGTKIGIGFFGQEIKVDLEAFVPTGYETPGTVSGPTHIQLNGNMVNVVYDRKIPMYKYSIEYYTEDDDYLGSTSYDEVIAGTVIKLTEDQLDEFKPGDEFLSGIQVNGSDAITSDNFVIKVVYHNKELQKVYINHKVQSSPGSTIYRLEKQTYVYAYAGDTLISEELQTDLGSSYNYFHAGSYDFIVKDGHNEIDLFYTSVPKTVAEFSDEITMDDGIDELEAE